MEQCAGCLQSIRGETSVVHIFERAWHAEHVVCKVCKLDLVAQAEPFFDEASNGLYCALHFNALHHKTCAGCGDVLVGSYIFEMDKYWHPDHFTCAACNVPFTSAYHALGGKPYCADHYYARVAHKCEACQEPILGAGSVRVRDQYYHKEHFVCSSCGVSLSLGYFRTPEGNLQCQPCSKEQIIANMRAAGQPVSKPTPSNPTPSNPTPSRFTERASTVAAPPPSSSSPSTTSTTSTTSTEGGGGGISRARTLAARPSPKKGLASHRQSWSQMPVPEIVGHEATPEELDDLMRHRLRIMINHLGAKQYPELRNAVLAVVKQVHVLCRALEKGVPEFDTNDLVHAAVSLASSARSFFNGPHPDTETNKANLRTVVAASRNLSDAGARSVDLYASYMSLGYLSRTRVAATTAPSSSADAASSSSSSSLQPSSTPAPDGAVKRVRDEDEELRKRASSGSELADDVPAGNFDRDPVSPEDQSSEAEVFVSRVWTEARDRNSTEVGVGTPVQPDEEDFQRLELIREIITSEEEYVGILTILTHDFMLPLRFLGESTLSEASRDIIFCNMTELYELHTGLLKALKEARAEQVVLTSITDILEGVIPALSSLYHTYGMNSSMAMAELASIRAQTEEHAEFLSFLASVYAKLNWAKESRLEQYLLAPLKRLVEFTLLIKRLASLVVLERTPDSPLPGMATDLEELTSRVHAARERMENWHRVVRASESIKGCPVDLMAYSERVHRKEGPLELARAKDELDASCKLETRYVFLFSDLMVWTKPTKKEGVFAFSGMARLVDIQGMYQNSAREAAFTLELENGCPVHWVAASSNERAAWLLALGPTLAEFQHELNRLENEL